MDEGWTCYRSLPPENGVVARVEQLPNGIALSILLDSAARTSPILLAASGGMILAFVNACPHRNPSLDYCGPKHLSCVDVIVRCTNHEAGCRIEDGAGVEGARDRQQAGSYCRVLR